MANLSEDLESFADSWDGEEEYRSVRGGGFSPGLVLFRLPTNATREVANRWLTNKFSGRRHAGDVSLRLVLGAHA